MADAVLLRRAAKKLVACLLVAGIGHWFLWPDLPVREWLEDNVDWKMKFAFIGWLVVSAGMAYDALYALGRGAIAEPGSWRR